MTQANRVGNRPLLLPPIDRAERNTAMTKEEAVPASASAATTRSDGTSVSDLGSLLAVTARSTSDVRTDRIAVLKSAIDSGGYRVPTADVADKLINAMLGQANA